MKPSDALRLRRAEAAAHQRLQANETEAQAISPDTPNASDTLDTAGTPDASGTPGGGSLYALDAGEASGIEWLLLGMPGDGRQILVPVDGFPVLGDGDIQLDPQSAAGPRIARASHGVELAPNFAAHFATNLATSLGGAQRSGFVSPEDCERIKARRRAKPRPAVEQEALEDPEYRRWLAEHLGPAIAALTAREAASEPKSQGLWRRRTARRKGLRRKGLRGLRRGLAVAATLLVGVALGWLIPSPPRPASEAALVWFSPSSGPTRDASVRRIQASSEATEIVLVFETLADRPYPRYRLEIERESGKLWHDDTLHLQGASEIVVVVPRQLLPAEVLTARLFGLDGEKPPVTLETWQFQLVD